LCFFAKLKKKTSILKLFLNSKNHKNHKKHKKMIKKRPSYLVFFEQVYFWWFLFKIPYINRPLFSQKLQKISQKRGLFIYGILKKFIFDDFVQNPIYRKASFFAKITKNCKKNMKKSPKRTPFTYRIWKKSIFYDFFLKNRKFL